MSSSASQSLIPLSHLSFFPNLVRFKFRNQMTSNNRLQTEDIAIVVSRILAFMTVHSTLNEIELSYLKVDADFIQKFSAVMSSLSGLQKLVLTLTGRISLADHLQILKAGLQLEKLHVSVDSSIYENQEVGLTELDMYRQQIELMKSEHGRIKDLSLNTELFEIIIADYLARCPFLEQLVVHSPPTVSSAVYQDISNVIKTHCPRLKHLDIRTVLMGEVPQAKLILACLPSSAALYEERSGLESIATRLYGSTTDITLNAMLAHQTTLTSVRISQGKGITATGLQRITTSCTHLKSLAVRLIFGDAIPILMDGIANTQWECTKLRSLSILFVDNCTITGREPATQYLQYLYGQIGTMTELETLSFRMGHAGWVPMRHTFIDCLGKLYQLRQLRVFGFRKEEASMLKKHHIEAMLQSWPKLEQLAGLLEDFRTNSLAQWLIESRPDLDLSALNDRLG
ncbi:hypothetical protein BCR41DRAFT_346522 [Lobosporangium transversale]|uniref:F-box domain-containing protein n=1 Tax=Lobosporangium transversale TaxID=64571 RepID=A0A1Y2GY61_9FUNG|nr:hypothetical protein BCR41DRAFT_346522 [Lobosporangium transversale]ORZ27229.1 hypothetical protein BCR41DRAFT_346522 [Lobosporangium transversale]|eukprot:XP_021884956.1 hypothetical protein BCR41DRAFT_346522 [Lobosporangium transversale]